MSQINQTLRELQSMNAQLEQNNANIQREAHRAAMEKARHDALMAIINKIG